MAKEAVFTMKLEPELRDAFMAEAEAVDRPASEIVRELMRDYVEKRRHDRGYRDFVARKVEIARQSMDAERGRSGEDVERSFAERAAIWSRRISENDE